MSFDRAQHRNFTYTDSKKSPLRGSFCELDLDPVTTVTYVKSRDLGTGDSGTVSLMVPAGKSDNTHPPIAVKKFNPSLNYKENCTDEEIKADVRKKSALFALEAECHKRFYGIGAYFISNEPFVIRSENGIKCLSSWPQSYVAMTYIEGSLYQDVHFTSSQHFFLVCIAVLKELQILNQYFVHSDIKYNNLYILEQAPGRFKARFVDFGLSRRKGEQLPISEYHLDLNIKPPEFKNKNSIIVHPNQDIYSLSRLFWRTVLFRHDLFQNDVAESLRLLFDDMMALNPEHRPNVSQAMDRITYLKMHDLFLRDPTKLNEKEKLLIQIRIKQEYYESKFPSREYINKWCHCEQLISRLNNEEASEESWLLVVKQELENVHALSDPDLIWTKNFIQNAFANTLLTLILSHIKNKSHLIPFLKHLHSVNPICLSRLCNYNRDYLYELIPVSDHHELMILMFESRRNQYRHYLENSGYDIEIMDKWCYCERFLQELNINGAATVPFAQCGYGKLHSNNWEMGRGVARFKQIVATDINRLCTVLVRLNRTMATHLLNALGADYVRKLITNGNALVALLNSYQGNEGIDLSYYLGIQFVQSLPGFSLNNLLDFKILTRRSSDQISHELYYNVAAQLVNRHGRDFAAALTELDAFYAAHPRQLNLYKKLLQASNRVYRDIRSNDNNRYHSFFSRFFGYSKENKIARSMQLERAVIVEGASDQGDLGEIARRLSRVG